MSEYVDRNGHPIREGDKVKLVVPNHWGVPNPTSPSRRPRLGKSSSSIPSPWTATGPATPDTKTPRSLSTKSKIADPASSPWQRSKRLGRAGRRDVPATRSPSSWSPGAAVGQSYGNENKE